MAGKKIKILFLIICTLQLFYLFHYRSGFKYEIIKNPFDENSGSLYALSPRVIESNYMLKKHKANDFALGGQLAIQSPQESYFYQRAAEFNYPIRIKKTSELIFFSVEDDIPGTCKTIETGKYLKLTQCGNSQ